MLNCPGQVVINKSKNKLEEFNKKISKNSNAKIITYIIKVDINNILKIKDIFPDLLSLLVWIIHFYFILDVLAGLLLGVQYEVYI